MTIPTLVTLDQFVAHAKLPAPAVSSPPSPEAVDWQQKIDAATQLVCEHIADRQPADPIWVAEIEGWGLTGSPLVAPPPLVVLAVLELAAYFVRYLGDDGGTDQPMRVGELPMPVTNLLVRYRMGAVA